MVGMSYNCHEGEGHVQSMIWALDTIGMGLLLQPEPIGIAYCPGNMVQAIYGEIRATLAIRNAGYDVDTLTTVFHSQDGVDLNGDGIKDGDSRAWWENCTSSDFFHENGYFGFNVHPFETIFMKSKRGIDEVMLGNLTEWVDGSGYDSAEHCRVWS